MADKVEFRVMPSGDGRWYWEVITPGPTVIARGVADTEAASCQQAREAARKAKPCTAEKVIKPAAEPRLFP